MDNNTALQVLEQALNIAAKAGSFTIQDSASINIALLTIKSALTETKELVTETKKSK